jgi:hypothetical protein
MFRLKPDLCRLLKIFRPWTNQANEFQKYWTLYGGIWAFVASPYPQVSIFLGLLSYVYGKNDFDPSSLTISIIPNLLGFTIGALAIILAFSSSKLFSSLADEGNRNSLFRKTIANFLHFITIQVISLMIAIGYYAYNFQVLKLFSSIFLIYAIFTALSTGVQLFQMAAVANMWEGIPKRDENKADRL